LDFIFEAESITSGFVRQKLQKVLLEWCPNAVVSASTTDNGKNFLNAMEALCDDGVLCHSVRCSAHLLNLIVRGGFSKVRLFMCRFI
jgi:hypothetical protein